MILYNILEFQNLKFLRVLDLSYNGLRDISDNLIKGCEDLKVRKTLKNACFVNKYVFFSRKSG